MTFATSRALIHQGDDRHPPEPIVARLSGERATMAPGGWLRTSFQAAKEESPNQQPVPNLRVSTQGGTPVVERSGVECTLVVRHKN
jgi:hypothetical protein